MADSKDPVEVPLTELQRFKLEAAETQVKLAKERVILEIQRKYAVLQALEVKQALDMSAVVKAADMRANVITNEVISELQRELPGGYTPTLLSWETGMARAEYNPEQVTRRLPVE